MKKRKILLKPNKIYAMERWLRQTTNKWETWHKKRGYKTYGN